jgi:flavin-dependent dehydrogenase
VSAPPSLAIAGAGPAGLAAATLLARAGRKVVVHERNATVGARFVGDLQVVEDASDRLETVPAMFARLGLAAPRWVPARTAEFFDAKMRRFEVSSKVPYAWFVTRGPGEGSLDTTLLAGALAAGAEVRFGSRLEPSSADLVATGPQTPDGLARETAFETDGVTRIRVLFDPSVAPGGYAYLFTVGGRGTFGCAIVKDLGGIDRYFGKARERLFSLDRVPVEGARDAYSFMNFALAPEPSQGGRPAAGEAGAFQDYLFGLGMRYAISSGALAAEALLAGRDFASLARERFAKRQRVSLVNRFLYEAGGAFGLSLFARLAARADFRSVLSAFYRPGPLRLALAPLAAALWRNRGRCAHRLPAHWCRRREREIRDVALGRIA